MAMPYALLRAGFPYVKTLGMRRVTDAPVDVAVGADDNVYVLCRLPGSSSIRKLTWDDDYLGPVGASEASFEWPVAIAMDAEDNIYVSDEAAHRITAITSDGDFLGSWGERGEGQGQLNGPSGIAFDLDGSLYVSDTLNHRVQRFTRDGVFLSTWGSFGEGDGQFNMPWGVAVDPVGDVYVVDWRNDRVQKFDSEGRFIHRFGSSGGGAGQFNRPAGIAVDGDGDVYVADLGNHRVQMYDRDGRYLQTFTGDGTLSKSARQYILANAKALRLRFESNLEPEKSLLGPTSLTVDTRGRMVIIDGGHSRVQVYQKDVIPLEETQIAPPPRVPTLDTV